MFDRLFILFVIAWLFVLLFIAVTIGYNPDETTHAFVGKFFRDFLVDWLKNPTLSYKKIYDYSVSYLVRYPKLSLHYAPIPQVFFAIVYLFLEPSLLVARLVVVMFSIAFIFLIYQFTLDISRSKKAALIAVLIFMSSPVFIYHSTLAMQEISFLFFFTLATFLIYKFFRTDNLKLKIFTIISIVLCILSKWQAIIIIPFLLVFTFFENRKKILKVFFLIIFSLLILLPYYFIQYKTGLLFIPFRSNLYGGPKGVSWLEASGWIYYLKAFVFNQFPIISPILLLLTFYYIKKKKPAWKLFATWVIVVYILMTLVLNKDPRYDINIFPAFVVPSSILIFEFGKRKRYKNIVPIFFVLLFIQFFYSVTTLRAGLKNVEFVSRYVVLNTRGNILPQALDGNFIFEISRADNFRHQVLRQCLPEYYNGSFDDMVKEYGIEYVIAFKGQVGKQQEFYQYLQSDNFVKEIELDDIVVMRNKEFVPKKDKLLCNYICSIRDVVCSEYTNPIDALK